MAFRWLYGCTESSTSPLIIDQEHIKNILYSHGVLPLYLFILLVLKWTNDLHILGNLWDRRSVRSKDVFETWHVLRYWPVERSGFSMAKQICRVKQTNLGAVPGDKSLICSIYIYIYMDWFKGISTGNHRFSHWLWAFPVNFPSNQSIEYIYIYVFMIYDMGIGWLILVDTKLTQIPPESSGPLPGIQG